MDDEEYHRELNVISHKTELEYNFQPSEWLNAVQPPLTHYFERVASLFPACFTWRGAARPVEGGKGASRPLSFQMRGSKNRDEGVRGCRRHIHTLPESDRIEKNMIKTPEEENRLVDQPSIQLQGCKNFSKTFGPVVYSRWCAAQERHPVDQCNNQILYLK